MAREEQSELLQKAGMGGNTEPRFEEHLNVNTISFSVTGERVKFLGKKAWDSSLIVP